MNTKDKENMKKISYHKYYNTYLGLFDKVESVLEGKPAILEYLVRHPIEKVKKYEFRKRLTSFDGWTDSIVQRWLATFLRAFIDVKLPSELEKLKLDIDLTGKSIKEFREKEILPEAISYSQVWGIIDEPHANEDITTKAEQEAQNIRPYVRIYSPSHITNFREDVFGNLDWVIVKTNKTTLVKTDGGKEEEKIIYQEYVPGLVSEFYYPNANDKEVKYIGEPREIVRHGKKIMPIIRKGGRKSKKYPGYFKIDIAGVCDKEIEYYNAASQLINTLAQINFQVLCGGKMSYNKELGNESYITLAKDDPMPKYLAPDVAAIEMNFKRLDMLINQIFGIACIKNRAVLADKAKSGEALLIEDVQAEDKTKVFGEITQQFEQAYLEKMCEFTGENKEEVKTFYPERYDIKTFGEELLLLQEVAKTKNAAFYLQTFIEVVTRKVSDPNIREQILSTEKNSNHLQLEILEPIIKELKSILSTGVINVRSLAKSLNPVLNEKTDAEVDAWIKENMIQFQELTNEFQITLPEEKAQSPE